jgi:3-hydroxyacyl-CoA dehydrogenase/enoyl-CoA hydratase/3-hydroxybutyryl-CoA epimerase
MKKLKNTITETGKVIDASVIYASNSTIPISQLAKASVRPDKFIDCIFTCGKDASRK